MGRKVSEGHVVWEGGSRVLLWQGGSVESDIVELYSNEEYKCMRNWISLVLLALDVIIHNEEVLFYEGTSSWCLLNLILHLHCPCTIWKIIHD